MFILFITRLSPIQILLTIIMLHGNKLGKLQCISSSIDEEKKFQQKDILSLSSLSL